MSATFRPLFSLCYSALVSGRRQKHKVNRPLFGYFSYEETCVRDIHITYHALFCLFLFVGICNVVVGCLKSCAWRLRFRLHSQHRTVIF